jgi:molecular chaperone GrpE (heat shock protein)
VTEHPTPEAALSERLARAEAEVEQARDRLSSSVLALREELARQPDWRRLMNTTDQIEAAARDAAAKVRPQVEAAKRRLSGWNETLTGYIKENPGRCLLGAVAIGFLVGKLARRA